MHTSSLITFDWPMRQGGFKRFIAIASWQGKLSLRLREVGYFTAEGFTRQFRRRQSHSQKFRHGKSWTTFSPWGILPPEIFSHEIFPAKQLYGLRRNVFLIIGWQNFHGVNISQRKSCVAELPTAKKSCGLQQYFPWWKFPQRDSLQGCSAVIIVRW